MTDNCIQAIANTIIKFAELRNIDAHRLIAEHKVHEVCETRYMAYTYLHYELGISSNKIGKYFNRPRRSVLRGIQILKEWMQYHSEIKNEYNSIVEQLKGGD